MIVQDYENRPGQVRLARDLRDGDAGRRLRHVHASRGRGSGKHRRSRRRGRARSLLPELLEGPVPRDADRLRRSGGDHRRPHGRSAGSWIRKLPDGRGSARPRRPPCRREGFRPRERQAPQGPPRAQ
ncbi:MAG: hypothetical protein M0C28_27230 [Candidatus Moduliflexus flocculans]|nr:hypothetical protein [Candidatus Moduliflexus flocculans]